MGSWAPLIRRLVVCLHQIRSVGSRTWFKFHPLPAVTIAHASSSSEQVEKTILCECRFSSVNSDKQDYLFCRKLLEATMPGTYDCQYQLRNRVLGPEPMNRRTLPDSGKKKWWPIRASLPEVLRARATALD